jgi:hypothetical protein
MKIKFYAVAVVWWLVGFLSSAQAQSLPCGCADKQDLLNLLNQTQMAIQESQFQTNLILAKEKADGKPVMATVKGLNVFYENLNNAAKSVSTKTYPGWSMDVFDCSVKKTSNNSDCVELIKKHFYDISQKACLANKSSRGTDKPYFEEMEMKSYLLQIMMAYSEMQKFILQMLKSLPKNCRPNDWFGYVVYQKVRSTVTVRTIPSRNTQFKGPSSGINIVNGGSETSGFKETYIGTTFFNGDGLPSPARAYAAISYDVSKTFDGRIYCSPRRPDESFLSTGGMKSFAEGQLNSGSFHTLTIFPDQRRYKIDVSFPLSVIVVGQSSRFSKTTGVCVPDPLNENGPIKLTVEGGSYGIDETASSSSIDYLEGTKTEKPYFLNQSTKQGNTSATNTHEIQVRWMLRRLSTR